MNFCMSNNEGIRNFFENGSDEYIPISEIIYIQTHPLIGKTFLTEISTEVTKVESIARNIPDAYLFKLRDIAIIIGKLLPTIDESNAEKILFELRHLYTLAKKLNAKDFQG